MMTRMIVEASRKQDQQIDEKQEGERRDVDPDQGFRDPARHVLRGDDVVEDERSADDEADRGRGAGARDEDVVEHPEAEASIEDRREDQRIEGRDRRRLGRRRHPTIDAVKKNDRHHQRRKGAKGGARQLPQGHRLLDREIAPIGQPEIHRHKDEAHQEPWEDAGEEEKTDRCVRDEGIEHHRDRRGNDRPDGGGGGRDRGGIAARIVAGLGHHLDDDLADTGRVRHRRTRHAGKDQRRHDVHMAEAAAKATDDGDAEAQEPVRYRAGIHDVRRHDEERHGKQDEALIEPVHQDLAGNPDALAGGVEIDEGCDDDRIGDGCAERRDHEENEDAEEEGETHRPPSPAGRSSGSVIEWRKARQTAKR